MGGKYCLHSFTNTIVMEMLMNYLIVVIVVAVFAVACVIAERLSSDKGDESYKDEAERQLRQNIKNSRL